MRKKKNPHGAGNIMPNGYMRRMVNWESQLEHIRVAETALGHPLPKGAIVHHADENRLNNSPGNLVICPDTAYHCLLHLRMRALKECGHADWRKCRICKQYDAPANLFIRPNGTHHRECMNAYYRNQRQERQLERR